MPPRASHRPRRRRRRSGAEGWWRPSGEPTTLATGLSAPWSVVAARPAAARSSRERDSGTVLELTAARRAARRPGVVPGVVSGGESGLHGLAVWQDDDDRRRWLYAYHGAADDNRVVRMPLLGEAGRAQPRRAEVVLTGHPAGRARTTAAASPSDRTGSSTSRPAMRRTGMPRRTRTRSGGKILRLTPEGEPAPGNPFGNAVWTLGHRNVQGIAWTGDGDDVGERVRPERLGRAQPHRRRRELRLADRGGRRRRRDRFTDPVAAWPTDEASPSGIAAVGDTVFVAGLRGERLWVVDTRRRRIAAERRPSASTGAGAPAGCGRGARRQRCGS